MVQGDRYTRRKLRLREHEENELAHYASKTVDIEFDYPWG